MITLENDYLRITIKEEGAELTSVFDKQSAYEFLWQGDPTYWGRQAPVLFPIVGRLKENTYDYQGHTYALSQHGFARDLPFHPQSVTANSASFYLKNDAETMAKYPFEFSLQINYILHDNNLTVTYEILNPSKDKDLYYSIGGHPAFNVQMIETEAGRDFQQLELSFEPRAAYLNIPLQTDGLIKLDKATYNSVDQLTLRHESFKDDALIYQIGRQTEVILKDLAKQVEIRLKPNRMDFIGIWSPYPKRAAFVCIEPWAGIADRSDHNGQLEGKYGIRKLQAQEIMTHDYTIEFHKK